MENIDYDALKKRGFLRQKQDGFFVLRTRSVAGIYKAEHIAKINELTQKYARGFVHATVRQGIEVPFIKFEDIPEVEAELASAGIALGTSGPRLRATTVCPGNNWCRQGLVNTFSLAERIEKELGIACGMDLPHKFKIAISGCPNACTRPQVSEIGIHGQAGPSTSGVGIGYVVYLGGSGGRTPRNAFKTENIFTEDEVLQIVKRVVAFYKRHAKPRQRFGSLIEEFGKENFLLEIAGKT
ncbi:MAG: hypothetical protein KKD29_03855 [Candidatus Omnitrophica bacterium]|nr:hypothetical protein [Candidatus Omnitrophota bacterium]MBU4488112.1 hypothetical protein [Candidatus Omnitrophota bacterium]MCG2705219.1 hypothetical protein [Candidatus Omnitrophota bacterium]